MSITIYSDVIAHNSLWSAGVRGKSMRVNRRAQVASGEKLVNVVQERTIRQYQFGTVPLTVTMWSTLEALYEVTDAGAYGFLVQDPKDGIVAVANGKASLISGTNYQLFKRITPLVSSGRFKDRNTKRVNAGSFVLYISGVPTLLYTLDPNTGIVAIPAAPAASAITWSGIIYVPVHFENDDLDWELTIAGPLESRFMTGPNVFLTEIPE